MALSQNEWITIKTLQESGSDNQEIARFLKMTTGKVSVATKSETYEEYKNNCFLISKRAAEARKANKSKKKEEAPVPAPAPAPEEKKPEQPPVQVVEHRQSITIQATHYMMEVLNEQLKMLKTISAKLALIVDDLYGEKKAEKEADAS